MTAARMIIVVAVTWVALTVLFLAPSALPTTWQYYIYSPASVGLWLLAMLFGPVITVFLKWNWIRHG
ncbi:MULTISPECIES: hypothetical protein [unclassified Streptomyces]|uniref:hypothetical protein n=1 Tax=unclassified Streptomyces TaxID=2593676 RepID=UPI002251C154|nr:MULTISPECIES: hypothetical protein [unclassified Streptomyces]MCX5434994.1 hypothetical protein [Streptomyces sp. NBC_00063]WSE12839.1 hypothetical protein OG518_05695 [Streptomyces sp. NBC_01397]WUB98215.1 hypothetical protein OHO83_41155 [Streptomyces sp. NBC_00569]